MLGCLSGARLSRTALRREGKKEEGGGRGQRCASTQSLAGPLATMRPSVSGRQAPSPSLPPRRACCSVPRRTQCAPPPRATPQGDAPGGPAADPAYSSLRAAAAADAEATADRLLAVFRDRPPATWRGLVAASVEWPKLRGRCGGCGVQVAWGWRGRDADPLLSPSACSPAPTPPRRPKPTPRPAPPPASWPASCGRCRTSCARTTRRWRISFGLTLLSGSPWLRRAAPTCPPPFSSTARRACGACRASWRARGGSCRPSRRGSPRSSLRSTA